LIEPRGTILVALGSAALLYGCYTFWLRTNHPERFGKLAAMKARWGDRVGLALHVGGYSVLPILFGLAMIYSDRHDSAPQPSPSQTDDLRFTADEVAALRFGMARGELLASGFVLVGGAKADRIDIADGDFKAAIVSAGRGWRVERSGHAPIDFLTIDEAVAKIFEAHRPKRLGGDARTER
jgi:hypothetical protein